MTKIASLRASRAAFSALLLTTSGLAMAQTVPIVQPGAPGQASKVLSAEEATKLAAASYTPEDVAFMQAMILHHQQAVDMRCWSRIAPTPRTCSKSRVGSNRARPMKSPS
ncbi:MAG: hypothetical protein C0471_12640 [Erythrobacter sp.]|nr:hypothetical protein [Erythrobacter sp.]